MARAFTNRNCEQHLLSGRRVIVPALIFDAHSAPRDRKHRDVPDSEQGPRVALGKAPWEDRIDIGC